MRELRDSEAQKGSAAEGSGSDDEEKEASSHFQLLWRAGATAALGKVLGAGVRAKALDERDRWVSGVRSVALGDVAMAVLMSTRQRRQADEAQAAAVNVQQLMRENDDKRRAAMVSYRLNTR